MKKALITPVQSLRSLRGRPVSPAPEPQHSIQNDFTRNEF